MMHEGADGILLLGLLFGICIAGSHLVESAQNTKEKMNILVDHFEELHHPITQIILDKNVVLTVWKFYTINRSFIFKIMGTLLSYGILLATLEISAQ